MTAGESVRMTPSDLSPLTVAEALEWADAHTVADLGTLPRTEWALVRLAAEVRRLHQLYSDNVGWGG